MLRINPHEAPKTLIPKLADAVNRLSEQRISQNYNARDEPPIEEKDLGANGDFIKKKNPTIGGIGEDLFIHNGWMMVDGLWQETYLRSL